MPPVAPYNGPLYDKAIDVFSPFKLKMDEN